MNKLILLLLLSSCTFESVEQCQKRNKPELFTELPDGMKIWKVFDCSTQKYIYFPSKESVIILQESKKHGG